MSARKDLPSHTASNFLERTRETLQTYLGRQGHALDRGLTVRDLIEAGVVTLRSGWSGGSGTVPLIPTGAGTGTGTGTGGSDGSGGDVYEPDLTPPPQPDLFTLTGFIAHFLIEQPPPFYTQGHGHLRTRVYGAQVSPSLPNPVFDDAVELDQFTGTIRAIASNPATTWRIWTKWESVDNVLSATPAGGTNGIEVTTAQDPTKLLEALTGQITSSQLHADLATPIAQINLPTTGILARLSAAETERSAIVAQIAALEGTPEYDNGVTYDPDDIVKYGGSLYRALATTTGNLPTNATYWEKIGDYASLGEAVAAHAVLIDDHGTRITSTEDGLVAESEARVTLASTVSGNHTTAMSAVASEATTRAEDDAAAAARLDIVEATVNNATTGVAATAAALDVVEALVNHSTTGVTATATKASKLEASLTKVTADGGGSLISDSEMANYQAWRSHYSQDLEPRFVTVVDGSASLTVCRSPSGGGIFWNYSRTKMTIDPARRYRMKMRVRPVGSNGTNYFTWWRNNVGNYGHSPISTIDVPDGVWSTITREVDGSFFGDTSISPGFALNHTGGTAGYGEIDWLYVNDITGEYNAASAQTAANSAQSAADAAQGDADAAAASAGAANTLLANIASDAKLTPVEKLAVRAEWDVIAAERAVNVAQAAAFGVTSTAYSSAFQSLANYLNAGAAWSSGVPVWISDANLSTTTDIVGATFRATFKAYYDARTAMLNAIAAKAKTLADNAQSAADAAQADADAAAAVATAAATALSILDAQVQDGTSGLSATVARVDSLQATIDDPSTGLDAVATSLESTQTIVALQGGTLNAVVDDLDALEATVSNPSSGLSSKASVAQVETAQADATSAAAAYTNTVRAKISTQTKQVFRETWSDPDALSQWDAVVGPGVNRSVVQVSDAVMGGKVVRIGDNSGNDMRLDRHAVLLEFDPSRLYKMRVRIRMPSGTGKVYLGISGLAADGVTYVHPSGPGVNHGLAYVVAQNQAVGTGWVEFVGYFKGHGASAGGSGVGASATAPVALHPQVRYFRPIYYVNYPSTPGVVEINYVIIDDVTEAQEANAAIQVEATTRADQTGALYAQYTVKTDVAGLVSGYGLASTANNAAPTSAFGVQAGQFFVAPPALAQATAPVSGLYRGYVWRDTANGITKYWTGSAWSTTPQTLPFIVQTVPATINGETVEPGVYMDAVFMKRFVAARGNIGLAIIDDARIADVSAGKLTARSISVGQYIQSTGYIASTSGWRINGDGTAEFSGVVVRGAIFATSGTIGGSTIGANYMRSTNYALGVGWNFQSDGTGQIGGVTVFNTGLGAGANGYNTNGAWLGYDGKFSLKSASGSVVLFDGTNFKAQNSDASKVLNLGATGSEVILKAGSSFEVKADGTLTMPGLSVAGGVLTISQVNVISTLNLQGQAVTLPVNSFVAGYTTLPSNHGGQAIAVEHAYTASGAPVHISASLCLDFIGPSSDTTGSAGVYVRIFRNGGLLYSRLIQASLQQHKNEYHTVAFTLRDDPPAGYTHYRLYTETYGGMSNVVASISNRCLFTLEVKR
jgi:predicted  nucleic acid-binding Zn-ribbon protein